MTLPPKLKAKLLGRFDELIAAGDAVLANPFEDNHGIYWVRHSEFVRWRMNCASLLVQVLPATSIHRKALDENLKQGNRLTTAEHVKSMLQAIKEDYERDFLEDLALIVEAELAGDYMGQAEALLKEDADKLTHIAAAVLTGAVLEKTLRTLCTRQDPPIATVTDKGNPLRLNALIDELKKAHLYNEARAKQLRAWADLRNHAAHGEFAEVKPVDVEIMLKGINSFVTDYMK